jgi:hypothetical protein
MLVRGYPRHKPNAEHSYARSRDSHSVVEHCFVEQGILPFVADGSAPATEIKRSFDAKSKALPSRVPVSPPVDSSRRFVYASTRANATPPANGWYCGTPFADPATGKHYGDINQKNQNQKDQRYH